MTKFKKLSIVTYMFICLSFVANNSYNELYDFARKSNQTYNNTNLTLVNLFMITGIILFITSVVLSIISIINVCKGCEN